MKVLIFDWGDTLMQDFNLDGPMYLWDKVEEVPGISNELKVLCNIYHCVVATNANDSGTAELVKALERLNLQVYFKSFFSSKELGYRKPDVHFFLSIADKLKVKPGNCMMIGNDYNKDIIGAKMAGMNTLLFDKDYSFALCPEADIKIHSMDQLFKSISDYGF